jgi:opacity protein-like surface antigen
MALGAVTLRAQMAQTDSSSNAYIPPAPAAQPPAEMPVSPPPAAPAPPPSLPNYAYGYRPSTMLAGSIDFPYAFNWDAFGISGELGALWDRQHFFGGEVSYYAGNYRNYAVFNGPTFVGRFSTAPRFTTVEAAYRYHAPIGDIGPNAPVSFYLGGGVGAGFVDYTNGGSIFGFRGTTNGAPTFEGLAGVEMNTMTGASLRLGFRYIDISDVWQLNHKADWDTGAFEVGASFPF